ncbi:MAG: hypothetical protein ACKODH_13185, partial [Limisphaerales bacterium]
DSDAAHCRDESEPERIDDPPVGRAWSRRPRLARLAAQFLLRGLLRHRLWIQPRQRGLTTSYTEWHPQPGHADEPKVLVISPDGRDGSARIHQDAEVYRLLLKPGQSVSHELKPGRGAWLQIATGPAALNGVTREAGDGASSEEPGPWALTAAERTEALLFDLA